MEAEDADILILTETKVRRCRVLRTLMVVWADTGTQVNSEPVDAALGDRYPYQYWSISDKKTYCTCCR